MEIKFLNGNIYVHKVLQGAITPKILGKGEGYYPQDYRGNINPSTPYILLCLYIYIFNISWFLSLFSFYCWVFTKLYIILSNIFFSSRWIKNIKQTFTLWSVIKSLQAFTHKYVRISAIASLKQKLRLSKYCKVWNITWKGKYREWCIIKGQSLENWSTFYM